MKILGFYISRRDWETRCRQRDAWTLYLHERIAKLEVKLKKAQRNDMPRDDKGRFISKQKLMTEQLRKEVAESKYVPSDQVPHYDDIKKAGK